MNQKKAKAIRRIARDVIANHVADGREPPAVEQYATVRGTVKNSPGTFKFVVGVLKNKI